MRPDVPRGMARGGGIAPVALTRSFLRFGERASEVRAPHASPGKVVERPADSAFQARPELAAETHDDFAALAAGAGDEFPCAGAAGSSTFESMTVCRMVPGCDQSYWLRSQKTPSRRNPSVTSAKSAPCSCTCRYLFFEFGHSFSRPSEKSAAA